MNRRTPIVAMTANAFEEDRRRCLAAGMNDHVGKPIVPARLFSALIQWLTAGPAGVAAESDGRPEKTAQNEMIA